MKCYFTVTALNADSLSLVMPKGAVNDRAISTPKGTIPQHLVFCSRVTCLALICPCPEVSVATFYLICPLPCNPGANVNVTFDEGVSAIFSDRGTSKPLLRQTEVFRQV